MLLPIGGFLRGQTTPICVGRIAVYGSLRLVRAFRLAPSVRMNNRETRSCATRVSLHVEPIRSFWLHIRWEFRKDLTDFPSKRSCDRFFSREHRSVPIELCERQDLL